MRRLAGSALAVAAVACLALPAFANGGQYQSPAAPPPDQDGGAPRNPASSPDWNDWWWAHRDRYVDIARRLRREHAAATATPLGGLGVSAGTDGAPAPEAAPPEDPRGFLRTFVLPVVTGALKDPDAEVRSAATIALGKMGFPRSFVDLQGALRDPHPDVRDGALLALGLLRDDLAVEQLRFVLHDPSVRERTRGFAALALGIVGGDGAASALLRFLSPEADAERVGGLHRTADLRASAVLALGHTGSPSAVVELRRLYATAGLLEEVPRACASVSLARLGDRESIPLLQKGLRHRETPMRQCAAIALGVLGRPADAEVIAALAKAASEDDDSGARQFAIMALGRIGGPRGREALRPFFDAFHGAEDRPYVLLALGISGDRASAPVVRRLFREERNPDVRGASALALGLLGDLEAAPELRAVAFGKGDSALRSHALMALGLMADAEAAPGMRRLLAEEEEPRFRLAAAVALGILGDPEAARELARLARKGPSVHVRAHSCYFLGLLGSREAAQTLVEVVEDPLEKMVVRMHAVAGLGVLGDRSPVPLLSGLGADGNYRLAVDTMQEVSTFL